MDDIEMRPATGEDGEHATFCRICTAVCGLIATVKDGKVASVKPDPKNPSSQGHVCVKGMSYHHVTHDPDRITRPMKRVAPGKFVAVSWDEALQGIADRLSAIIEQHGPDAVASYQGNPPAYSSEGMSGYRMFLKGLGVEKIYGAGSQDTNARFVADYVLYGSPLTLDVPDINNADFMLIFGANPLVSNGSLIFTPRARHQLDAVAKRGEVVVVDPRRSETAARYTHQAIQPNSDVWLMLSLLRIMVDADLIDHDFLRDHTVGWDEFRGQLERVDLDFASRQTGIARERMKDIAHRFATTERAAAYGRVGVCRGPFATLVNFLLSSLNLVGGKFGNVGGATFATPVLAGSDRATTGGYDEARTRFGNFPSVTQFLASAMMPADMLEDGPGKVRALFSLGGNALLAAPGGDNLERALQQMELSVSVDLYINESGAYCDYVLPGLTFYERADLPMVPFMSMVQPFLQYTDPVIEPIEEARGEFEIFNEILVRMGRKMPAATSMEADAQADGRQIRPLELLDMAIRMGPAGDQMGEREGWSIDRLRDNPHGVMLDIPVPYGSLDKIGYPDRKIRLWHELIEAEFARLWETGPASTGLKLITRRDIRSHNGWLHNVDRLVRSQHAQLQVHPDDADRLGLQEGAAARLFNKFGEIMVMIEITDEVIPGVVSYPHGWGHGTGSWQRANQTAGVNMNVLLGLGEEIVEAVSGTTIMDGIVVELEALPAALAG